MESEKKPEVIENMTSTEEMEEEKRSKEIAAAYARYLIEHDLKPGDATFADPESLGVDLEDEEPAEPVDIADEDLKEAIDKAEKIVAGEYRSEILSQPEDEAATAEDDSETESVSETAEDDSETESVSVTAEETDNSGDNDPENDTETHENKSDKDIFKDVKVYEESSRWKAVSKVLAKPVEAFDRVQNSISETLFTSYRDTYRVIHDLLNNYRQARKEISRSIIIICIMCAAILLVFDKNTVYEYAYNGKVLGYVEAQEDVTNVLGVAAEKLNEINTATGTKTENIDFAAGDNITFKLVEGSNKDADDENATVNKLAYMTDIEVPAYGIYDNGQLVTVVKSENAAQGLLNEVMGILGKPHKGMEVVSVQYKNKLDIRPVNVLLTSVQSNTAAKKQMTKGGDVKIYHLVENDETMQDIADTFSVKTTDIYDSRNDKPAAGVESGDKVCIRKKVNPVNVELVEKGKMKEVIKYKTIRKKTKKLYKGDEEVKVKGVDGVQIFEGTITVLGGEVVKRDTDNIDVITKKVDKVILVGTSKRPKTAPTGIFKNPMTPGTYIVTSRPGPRWGRTHEGVDMAASIGTPVYASDGGTVVRAEYYSGYGNCIDIEHKDGWISRYGHLNSFGVKAGDKVYQGQYIAGVGNTGRSTGPHLHFEIRYNGVFVNPDTKVEGGL